jgi:hypothetical protein
MFELKKGQKVIILPSKELEQDSSYEQAIGKIGIIEAIGGIKTTYRYNIRVGDLYTAFKREEFIPLNENNVKAAKILYGKF